MRVDELRANAMRRENLKRRGSQRFFGRIKKIGKRNGV